jgi:hypothetical protein
MGAVIVADPWKTPIGRPELADSGFRGSGHGKPFGHMSAFGVIGIGGQRDGGKDADDGDDDHQFEEAEATLKGFHGEAPFEKVELRKDRLAA